DLFEILDRLGAFDLGNHPRVAVGLANVLTEQAQIARPAHEGEGDEVDLVLQSDLEIAQIFLGQDVRGHIRARQVDALVLLEQTAIHNGRVHIATGDLVHDDLEIAIVDQDALTWLHVLAQELVAGADANDLTRLGIFSHHRLVGNDDQGGVRLQPDWLLVLEPPDTDLRPLQIREHTDLGVAFAGDTTHQPNTVDNPSVITVRTVDPENVGPSADELGQDLVTVRGGAERGYDFGSIGQQHGL